MLIDIVTVVFDFVASLNEFAMIRIPMSPRVRQFAGRRLVPILLLGADSISAVAK